METLPSYPNQIQTNISTSRRNISLLIHPFLQKISRMPSINTLFDVFTTNSALWTLKLYVRDDFNQNIHLVSHMVNHHSWNLFLALIPGGLVRWLSKHSNYKLSTCFREKPTRYRKNSPIEYPRARFHRTPF